MIPRERWAKNIITSCESVVQKEGLLLPLSLKQPSEAQMLQPICLASSQQKLFALLP